MANLVYQQQIKRQKKWVLTGFILSFILIISSILLFLYPFDARKQADYFTGEYPIVFNGKQVGNGMIDGKSVYVPFTFMKEYIDEQLIFDDKSHSIIMTTPNKVIQMPLESLTYYVNQKHVSLQTAPVKALNGENYMALDTILSIYGIQYSVLPETKAIEITKDGMKKTYGTIKGKDINEKRLRLRTKPDLQAPYTAQTRDKDIITIEKEGAQYFYVRKENGIAGYLDKKYVMKDKTETIHIQKEQVEMNIPQMNGPINLTWEAVYTKNPNTAAIPEMPGVNVVSPTWFELTNTDGTVKDLGSLEYVNWAKARGYQVWALFSNGFNPDLTHKALKDFETRQNIIRQLLAFCQTYQLNGINLDIENVREEDGPLVTQFVREITPYLHQAGLIVSMDITFITDGNWSAFYEREKLAETVDYLMVMAYDEHWGTSPEAGSVASFPWVEQNLKNLLEVVPNDKLILGVPLYTRLWEIKDTGEVSSKSMKMAEAKEWLAEKGVTPVYDEGSGQNYAEYYDTEAKATYHIWLEDDLSLNKRAELAAKYELKGIASWSRYFADETAWLALASEKNQVVQNQ
ncbi:glycosyl hydrolase family 18 protein [Bacillus benzoevorans]|uniref:Spore germination protein YaaH n=1 Tax=Bacillus benzoevorans TaxID=1456 RepID=A0A7X0LXA3_9BACI|nr:glycosyl hydrolase family 18 protein [Bacillus benzoevorans]MBB6447400.1 spore germination protein YaaH [Bacillus benzoevorans]